MKKPFNSIEFGLIIPDIMVLQPTVSEDFRGKIWTTWLKNEKLYGDVEFTHDKFSKSRKNVLRGLHGDNKTWKLISCPYGSFYLVVVDNRPDSITYKKWDSWIVSDENRLQVLVPPQMCNGHLVLTDEAVFHYKLGYFGEYNDWDNQDTLFWNDPELNIQWPIQNPILYGRDDPNYKKQDGKIK